MNEIKTKHNAKLFYGYDSVTKLVGLVIASGGNGKNPHHTIMFRDILYKLKKINARNVKILVAADNTVRNNYSSNEYRKIRFDNQTEFDFKTIDLDRFKSNANEEIREKGKINPETLNGSIHKRLLITSDLDENDWNELFGNPSVKLIANQEIINNQNEDELEYTYQKVKKRLRQSKFRKELLVAYNNTCAVTGSKVVELLEAAHIQPYDGVHTSVVSNGILLRSDIHDLFDIYVERKRLINISVDHRIEVHSSLEGSEYWDYNGKLIRLPNEKIDYPVFK